MKPNLQTSFLFLCLAGVSLLAFFVFSPFLQVLAVSTMAAVVCHRFHLRLTSLLGGRGSLSAFLTVLAVVILLLVPITFVGTQVFAEAADLYTNVSENRDAYFQTLHRVLIVPLKRMVPGLEIGTDAYARQALSWITSNLGSVFSGTVGVIANVFLFVVAFYFCLKDGRGFTRSVIALSPLPDKYDEEVIERMERAINSMVRGQLLVALIQGVLAGFGFWLFGVPSPALWGCVAALCALIPGVGTSLVILPAVIFLFATGETWPAVGLLIWGGTAVGLVDNALGPFLIGKGARIHPLFVLFAVLGGLTFFGPLGFLLGPLTIALLFALLDIYRLLVLKERPILTGK